MDDLNFVKNYFKVIHIIWFALCAISVLCFIFACCRDFEGIVPLIIAVAVYLIGYVGIKLNEIMFTRFVAATENIYEITKIMESKNEALLKEKKEKELQEKKAKEIANTEKEIFDLEAKLAKAKEKFNGLKQ